MNLDKNTVIGFILLGVLFVVFFWYTNSSQRALAEINKRRDDSLARIAAVNAKPLDTVAARIDSLHRDSVTRVSSAGSFAGAGLGAEQLTKVSNELMTATFSNKGGRLAYVTLKNFKAANGQPVQLGQAGDRLDYRINTASNNTAFSSDLFFTVMPAVTLPDGTQKIGFILKDSSGESVEHDYIVRPKDYMIDWNVTVRGVDRLLTGGIMNFEWKTAPQQQERGLQYERQRSFIGFSEGNSFDYISSKTERKFEKPVQWLSVAQQFFNTSFVSGGGFSSGQVQWARNVNNDSSNQIGAIDATLQVKVPMTAVATVPFRLYYGLNDYKLLSKEEPGMDEIVDLGRDAYSFVRPVNKYVIMPVFNFFAGLVSNFGWVILLLTVFIRLVTSPLTYTSYLSGAKMKVLRPEMDAVKAKFGDDKQGFAMEQMKLYKEAGVNPLGGCIPALLQIPIFFALFSFFNSNIALRGQPFLWSHDLSSYDSIATLPFSVPGYGDHVSLFTITAVITSFLISIYNMASTPTQDNPALKYMPYIFPFVMLFFFNRLPSALTWYYTVSNTLTLLLQFVIQTYIIDHTKILARIDEKRKAPKVKAKSKWQERYDQMLESQKKVQDMKNRNKK